jgi:hypothetical protein
MEWDEALFDLQHLACSNSHKQHIEKAFSGNPRAEYPNFMANTTHVLEIQYLLFTSVPV